MKTILAAIDFSDVSEKVLAQAAELARATGAKLHIVHGVEQIAAFYDIYGYTVPDLADYSQQAADRASAALNKRVAKMALPDEQTEVRVLEGPFLETLLDYRREIAADMLVVGSHGHGFVARVLIGSTAQRILHKSEVPTLVVPA